MKMTICGSLHHMAGILQAKEVLESQGHTVETPEPETQIDYRTLTLPERASFREMKIREHVKKIRASDAILVYNETKNDIAGYIGGSTLIEMAFTFVFDKPIFLYHPVPEMAYTDEILGMQPIVLHGQLENIK